LLRNRCGPDGVAKGATVGDGLHLLEIADAATPADAAWVERLKAGHIGEAKHIDVEPFIGREMR
jgi:hypothetical protein